MAFTNIISGTIGGNGNIVYTNYSSKSNLQVRYDGTGDWLECSENANITGKSNCSFELKLKDGETLTSMQDMFWNCSSLTSLDLSNLDTSSVTDMQSVFNNCSSLTSLNVSNFNTSQVTTMNSMFFNCSSLISLDLSSFDTSQITNMLTMFHDCTKLTSLDLSNFDTGKVNNMNSMFYNCPVSDIRLLYATSSTINSLVTQLGTHVARNIYYTDAPLDELTVQNNITYIKFIMGIIAKYKFDSNLYADYLPVFNTQFTGYTKTDFNNGDGTITRTIIHNTLKPTSMRFGSYDGVITNREKSLLEVMECDTSNITTMSNMFRGCSNLTLLNTSNFDTSNVTTMSNLFHDCLSLTSLDLSKFNTSKVTNMSNMFYSCKSLTSLDLSNFNTSQVTTMMNIFYMCSSLTSLDLSNFNTNSVTRMDGMFKNCSSLTSLDLSSFDTSRVDTMSSMFDFCPSLTSLDLSKFNTSKVTNMWGMFNGCSLLTSLDLSSFDTSKVTDIAWMFNGCNKLISLDLSNFNTDGVTSMSYMFNNCSSLTSLDVSNFDTSNVTNMSGMFQSCSSLTTLDVSNFDTSSATNMSNTFANCSSLTSLDISNFDTSSVTSMSWIFGGCSVSDIGLLYATSSTINTLLTHLGTSVARNIYYTDAPLNELTVQDNITYKKYELSKATFPYTLNKLPNGVADYIDVVNKVHVQRVGVFVAEGSDDEAWGEYTPNTIEEVSCVFSIILDLKCNGNHQTSTKGAVICDKWEFGETNQINQTNSKEECIQIYNSTLRFKLHKDRLSSVNVNSLKTYLQANQFTVLYELATPIYTSLTEEEIAQLPLSAYADGYINLSSDQLMPSFEFRMRASNRYQVDMLETGYYYLNAPVGNVKLGTANVDVQQMPCIVKVDNVGTGDSGYRLGINGHTSFLSLNKSNFTLGYYYGYSGELLASDRDCACEEYIPISTGDSILINQLYQSTADPYSVSLILYDSDKNVIERTTTAKDITQKIVTNNVSYFRFSCIHDRTVTEPTTKVAEVYINPITLAKLPSHRIPTTFTQGMKCVTDFGYWEGIKSARPSLFKTVDRATWNNIEVSEIENGSGVVLNRIEYNNTIVEDELDIATGKFTKRIGKVVLDGSNDCLKESFTANNQVFQRYIIRVDAPHKNDCLGLTNYLPFLPSKDKYGVDYVRARETNDFWLYQKEDLSTEEVRKRLAGNPITVYFELEVPEISYINLSSNQVKTVANTALQCSRVNGYLNPQVKPSHLTYPVPSLVGNRTYTVVHNRKNISGSTKPIELNLGGTVVQLNDASSKTLVKTPSTLAHSNLIFIGGESTVDHVMVLDGDWTNKPIEYFENMKGHDTDAIITIIGDGKIDDVAEQYLW